MKDEEGKKETTHKEGKEVEQKIKGQIEINAVFVQLLLSIYPPFCPVYTNFFVIN
jgi:hypothetical protein